MASGQAYSLVNEVGSSLTCLPPFRGLLGACSSVVESLSCSYDESVSVMMLQVYAKCMFGLLKMRNENLVSWSPIAKCVPCRKGLWEIWTVGIVNCNQVKFEIQGQSLNYVWGLWDLGTFCK